MNIQEHRLLNFTMSTLTHARSFCLKKTQAPKKPKNHQSNEPYRLTYPYQHHTYRLRNRLNNNYLENAPRHQSAYRPVGMLSSLQMMHIDDMQKNRKTKCNFAYPTCVACIQYLQF